MSLLAPGDKVLLVHRRLFEDDGGRYLLGTADAYDSGVVKVTGVTCVRGDIGFVKKVQVRTKIMSLGSGGLIGYQLPSEIESDELIFLDRGPSGIVLTDQRGCEFDMMERPRAA